MTWFTHCYETYFKAKKHVKNFLYTVINNALSCDRRVGMTTKLQAEQQRNHGSGQFPGRTRNFSLLQIVQTTSRDRPASPTCLHGVQKDLTFIPGNFD